MDAVQYWRDQSKNEVDFILKRKQAYEAKFSNNLVRQSKYKIFRETYPGIPLEFVTFDNVLEKIVLEN